MDDRRIVFQVSASPTLGASVFALDYRASGRTLLWWRRRIAACRRLIVRW